MSLLSLLSLLAKPMQRATTCSSWTSAACPQPQPTTIAPQALPGGHSQRRDRAKPGPAGGRFQPFLTLGAVLVAGLTAYLGSRPLPASAELEVCNYLDEIVEAAYAYDDRTRGGSYIKTSGIQAINSNSCDVLTSENLGEYFQQKIYVYVQRYNYDRSTTAIPIYDSNANYFCVNTVNRETIIYDPADHVQTYYADDSGSWKTYCSDFNNAYSEYKLVGFVATPHLHRTKVDYPYDSSDWFSDGPPRTRYWSRDHCTLRIHSLYDKQMTCSNWRLYATY